MMQSPRYSNKMTRVKSKIPSAFFCQLEIFLCNSKYIVDFIFASALVVAAMVGRDAV